MNINERINAKWCIDSETGEDVLMDLETNRPLYRGDRRIWNSTSEAAMTYQDAYNKGRKDAFQVADAEQLELREEIEDLREENRKLNKSMVNFVRLGMTLFRVEAPNEQ